MARLLSYYLWCCCHCYFLCIQFEPEKVQQQENDKRGGGPGLSLLIFTQIVVLWFSNVSPLGNSTLMKATFNETAYALQRRVK